MNVWKKCLTFEPTFWYCPIPIKINLWRKWYVIKQLKNRGLLFFSLDQLVTKNQIINTKWQSFLCTSKFKNGRGQPGFRKKKPQQKTDIWYLVMNRSNEKNTRIWFQKKQLFIFSFFFVEFKLFLNCNFSWIHIKFNQCRSEFCVLLPRHDISSWLSYSPNGVAYRLP